MAGYGLIQNWLNCGFWYRYKWRTSETSEIVKTVLATSSCQYLRAVTFPDTLWIGVRTKKIGNTSMVQEYAYFSTGQNAIVATGEAVLVMFEADGVTKRPLSEAEKQKIVALEK